MAGSLLYLCHMELNQTWIKLNQKFQFGTIWIYHDREFMNWINLTFSLTSQLNSDKIHFAFILWNFVLYFKLALLTDSYWVDLSLFPLIRTSPLTRFAIWQITQLLTHNIKFLLNFILQFRDMAFAKPKNPSQTIPIIGISEGPESVHVLPRPLHLLYQDSWN